MNRCVLRLRGEKEEKRERADKKEGKYFAWILDVGPFLERTEIPLW